MNRLTRQDLEKPEAMFYKRKNIQIRMLDALQVDMTVIQLFYTPI
ncbi:MULTISPECIES: hypothetical protein [Cytobacillus]|nr:MULTISPECIES: hypothetical protein [Cytobacillus]